MRFNEFKVTEKLDDIEQDPAVKFYRMMTSPFDSTAASATDQGTSPSAASVNKTASVKGNYPAFKEPGFKDALEKAASNLGIDPNHLIAIMKQESSLNPQAVNPTSGATGLIQFMPKTASGLGTSTSALHRMTATEQMPWVEKYFKSVGIRPGMTLGDLYVAVFYPKALGQPDNYVISQTGRAVYNQNRGLDHNRDGALTVADVKNSVARFA